MKRRRLAELRLIGDRRHSMLFAGYQTNPNYLGICWTFFERLALFAQCPRVRNPEAFPHK
jgi:hypothetical protein